MGYFGVLSFMSIKALLLEIKVCGVVFTIKLVIILLKEPVLYCFRQIKLIAVFLGPLSYLDNFIFQNLPEYLGIII